MFIYIYIYIYTHTHTHDVRDCCLNYTKMKKRHCTLSEIFTKIT